MNTAGRTFWGLAGLFVVAVSVHVAFLGGGLHNLATTSEFRFEQSLEITGAVGAFDLQMRIPSHGPGVQIRDEAFETADLDLEVQESPGGRLIVVSGGAGTSGRHVRYRGLFRSLAIRYVLDPDAPWTAPSAADSAWLAASDEIQVAHPDVGGLLGRLFAVTDASGSDASGSDDSWSDDSWSDASRSVSDWPPARWQRELAARGIGPAAALRRVYDYAWQGLRPATFSGTTDALTALRLGESSCGGKSRLMVALCRRLGLPSRIIGGVIMSGGPRKRVHHLWVETRLGGHWIPSDPLNGHFATRPAHFLELYKGDLPLIRHSRGLTFDYGFRSERQRVPLVWLGPTRDAAGDADATAPLIPMLDRRGFSALLLAPVCLLLIVFARQVVGLESIGTFLPILLGYSLVQSDWLITGFQMLLAIGLGVLLRAALGRLNLLHVPRTAVMITFVVLVFLAFSAGLSRFDTAWGVGAVVLPIAALAMAIEKFTVVAMDKGTPAALFLFGQTLLLALICRAVMVTPFFRNLIVAFPETLLPVVAAIIMLGSYRGLRWREWWRFRQVGPGGPPC